MRMHYERYEPQRDEYFRSSIDFFCPHCESGEVKIIKNSQYRRPIADGSIGSRQASAQWLCQSCQRLTVGNEMIKNRVSFEIVPKPESDIDHHKLWSRIGAQVTRHWYEDSAPYDGVLEVSLNEPRSLRDPNAIERKNTKLFESHIKPLTEYVFELRREKTYFVRGRLAYDIFPEFDPDDGGINARILFLFSKPGPKSAGMNSSDFVSRDNDDPTSELVFKLMVEAGIPREDSIIWNVVPGWNWTVAIKESELLDGISQLNDLIGLLVNKPVVVLVGRKAQRAKITLEQIGLNVFESPYPSKHLKRAFPNMSNEIPKIWKAAYERARGSLEQT